MGAQLSYINLINYFSGIAADHEQISSFYFGPKWDAEVTTEASYPIMIVIPQTSVLRKDSIVLKHKIQILDIISKDASNREQVLSDNLATLMEVKAFIWKDFFFDIFPTDESDLQPVYEEYNDELGGWSAEVDLQLDWLAEVCSIPGLYPSGVTFQSQGQFYSVNLANYLPLTGGILTGGLTGTTATFESVSAVTISGDSGYFGNIYSGDTNLTSIFLSIYDAIGSATTVVQSGVNTYTGGTTLFPSVNLNPYIELSGVTATTISATTYLNLPNQPSSYWTSGSTGHQSIKAINDSGLDATGDYSVAEGYGTLASGAYGSHAEGLSTTANGANGSHAEGSGTQANGISSHAEGQNTEAFSNFSHAEGNQTLAYGTSSHSEGSSTVAYADGSHAEGQQTSAFGINSHAGGISTIVNGDHGFIHGSASTSNGIGTIVLGDGLTGNLNNYTYVNGLNINQVPSGTSVNNLGIDSSGNVVIGSTATTVHDTFVTGGTYNTSTGIETFTNNTGGTFSVSGLNTQPNYFPITGGTVFGSVNIQGNVNVVGTASTFNTQVIQAEDNNIHMNYSGTHLTASGGGIIILSGVSNSQDSSLTIDSNGNWSATTSMKSPIISATTYLNLPPSTDTYVTGYTYSANTFRINQNNGQVPLSVIANVFTALTISSGSSVTSGATLTIINLSGGSETGSMSPFLDIIGSTLNNSNYPGLRLIGGNSVSYGGYPFIAADNGGFSLKLSSGQYQANTATLNLDAFDGIYVTQSSIIPFSINNSNQTLISNINSVNNPSLNAVLSIGPCSTGMTSLNIQSGVTATNSNNGDIWNDGTWYHMNPGLKVPSISASTGSINTITNSLVIPRSSGETTNTATTINTNLYDFWTISGLTSADTITTTGSPYNGQDLKLLISGSSSQNITFSSNFNFSTYLLAPSATTANHIIMMDFTYLTLNSKWNCTGWIDGF